MSTQIFTFIAVYPHRIDRTEDCFIHAELGCPKCQEVCNELNGSIAEIRAFNRTRCLQLETEDDYLLKRRVKRQIIRKLLD